MVCVRECCKWWRWECFWLWRRAPPSRRETVGATATAAVRRPGMATRQPPRTATGMEIATLPLTRDKSTARAMRAPASTEAAKELITTRTNQDKATVDRRPDTAMRRAHPAARAVQGMATLTAREPDRAESAAQEVRRAEATTR